MANLQITDKTLLRSLLDAGRPKLSPSEITAFTRMLEDLEAGMLVRLSKAQRLWTEQKYSQLDLDKVYKDRPVPKTKVSKVHSSAPLVWDQKKVLKPPGKKV
jgi:hypothetical protein